MTDVNEDNEHTALATATEVAQLVGSALPDIRLASTAGSHEVSLRDVGRGFPRLVVYAYPAIGAPDRAPITPDWMTIPGAFGCTAESCSFRDLNEAIRELGAAVCGLSTQSAAEQHEAAQRLSLNFPLLSDHDCTLTDSLGLPTWHAAGRRLLKRFTMVTHGPVVEHVFAPVSDPATHAGDVTAWLRDDMLGMNG
jgi:peroxiredoxin